MRVKLHTATTYISLRAKAKPSESNEETGRDSIDRDFKQNGNVE